NRLSRRARSPGATERQVSNAFAAWSITTSVSAAEVGGISVTTSSLAGLRIFTSLQPLEAAPQLPVGDRRVERGQLDAGVVGVVVDDVIAERLPRQSAVLPQRGGVAQGRRYPGGV